MLPKTLEALSVDAANVDSPFTIKYNLTGTLDNHSL
jgi:hypothetical protein